MRADNRMLELAGLITERDNPDLPYGKWQKVTGSKLEKYRADILQMIKSAYEKIGGHPNYQSVNDISTSDAQAWEIIDVDDDPEPDAIVVGKKKPHGMKLVGLGHDGGSPAKKAALSNQTSKLKKKGYYVEVSGKIYDIFKSAGIKIITDEKLVRDILKGKDIKWHGDGTYDRKIGGTVHTKIMMGYPK